MKDEQSAKQSNYQVSTMNDTWEDRAKVNKCECGHFRVRHAVSDLGAPFHGACDDCECTGYRSGECKCIVCVKCQREARTTKKGQDDDKQVDEQSAKQAAVEKVVEDLFTNGGGFKATRLVLIDDADGCNLGGWSRKPIADKLAEIYDAGVLAERAVWAERLAGLIGGEDEN